MELSDGASHTGGDELRRRRTASQAAEFPRKLLRCEELKHTR